MSLKPMQIHLGIPFDGYLVPMWREFKGFRDQKTAL